jgi:hypothetical protein
MTVTDERERLHTNQEVCGQVNSSTAETCFTTSMELQSHTDDIIPVSYGLHPLINIQQSDKFKLEEN